MTAKKAKIFGIVAIFIAFIVTAYNSIAITSPSILDTDASTYIIVVMLMLFVFIAFAAKEDLQFESRKRNLACALAIFLAYVALISYLRVSLSFGFVSYRIDALLFPLPLLAFIILAFGFDGAKKLAPIVIYAAFASPAILLPLLNMNNSFANLNAELIYAFVKGIGAPVSRIGLMITSAAGSITVSTTCVSIGTFVAFVMFLIPIAYLYEGKIMNKLYWLISGIVLILVLNLLRMLSIALIWVLYGISSAVNTFHLFAGQLIFYIAIVLMVLLSYKYSLGVKKAGKGASKGIRSFYKVGASAYCIAALMIVLAAIAFFFNYGYASSVYVPALFFNRNTSINSSTIGSEMLGSLENSNSSILILGAAPEGELFLLGGNGISVNSSIYVVANVSYVPIPEKPILNYTKIGKPYTYLLKNGVAISTQMARSGNTTFEINYFSLPYNYSGSWVTANYNLFEKTNATVPNCAAFSYTTPDGIDSAIYNILNAQAYKGSGLMCQSYLIAISR